MNCDIGNITKVKEEEGTGFLEPISLRLPSRPEYVVLSRLLAAQVGQIAGFEPEEIYDLKLAVTEAATNVIRHAKVDLFEIEYRARPRVVEITVTDAGGGFDAEHLTHPPDEKGGFGLTVIRSLADEVMLDSASDGTRLTMIRRSSSPAESSGA